MIHKEKENNQGVSPTPTLQELEIQTPSSKNEANQNSQEGIKYNDPVTEIEDETEDI